MKFLRHTLIGSALFLSLFFGILYHIFSYGPSDINKWEKMQAKSQKVQNREYRAAQERKKVRKDVLLAYKEGKRLKMRLEGDRSQLVLDNRRGGEGLVENIENASCYMQEELLNDARQVIRFFYADKAKYHNREGVFSAKDVEVTRSVVPGWEIPETLDNAKPLMAGLAESVHFSLKEKTFNFTAHHLHAALYKE